MSITERVRTTTADETGTRTIISLQRLRRFPRPASAARLDHLTRLLHGHALTVLRLALGLVYAWFGALKIAGISPAAALVLGTVPWPAPVWLVPALGWFEVALGLWLVTGRGVRVALPLFVAHMAGTLGVLALMPQEAYQRGNPLQLTMVGEFVVKNLVLLAAGVVVGTRPTSNGSHQV